MQEIKEVKRKEIEAILMAKGIDISDQVNMDADGS